jgi:hypothetical protein
LGDGATDRGPSLEAGCERLAASASTADEATTRRRQVTCCRSTRRARTSSGSSNWTAIYCATRRRAKVRARPGVSQHPDSPAWFDIV